MIECKNAKRYKGTRLPRCNGGEPCLRCQVIYLTKTTLRLIDVIERLISV